VPSKHLRQVGGVRPACIAIVIGDLPGAIGCDLGEPVRELAITTKQRHEAVNRILARPAALRTLDPKDIELADQVGGGKGTFAGDVGSLRRRGRMA
jgi:hypothetical protein